MTENSATIALKGDPSNLLSALGMGATKTQDFGNKATKSINSVTKATDNLTQSTLKDAAATVKSAAAWAMFAASFTKVATVYYTVELAATATGYALANTGKSLKTFDERLEGTKNILRECAGDIDLINDRLMELGVTAEEAGIEVETNLTKIQKSFGKLYAEITNKDAGLEKAGSEISRSLEGISARFDKGMSNASDRIAGFIDTLRVGWQTAQDGLAQQMQSVDAHASHIKQTDAELREYQEKTARDNKVTEIKRKMYAADFEAFEQYYQAKTDLARRLDMEQEVDSDKSIKNIDKRIEAANKELIRLRDIGQLNTKQGLWQQQLNDTLLAQKEKLVKADREFNKALHEQAEALEAVGKAQKSNQKMEAAAVANVGNLKAMLEEELELRHKINEVHGPDSKEAAEQIRLIQTLQEQLKRRELQDIADVAKAKELAANQELALKKVVRDADRDIEDTKIDIEQEKTLRALELQGATIKKLHEQRMKYIEEEKTKAIDRLDVKDPNQIAQIRAAAEIQRIREVARFEQQKEAEALAIKKVYQAEAWALEDEHIANKGASEKQLYELNIRRIKERAAEEDKVANTEAEHLEIKLKLERAIREEEERFLNLKKQGVNVDVNTKTGEMDKDTRTRSQRNADTKKAVAANKKALKLAKAKTKLDALKKAQDVKAAKTTKLAATKAANIKKQSQVQGAAQILKERQQDFGKALEGFNAIKDAIKTDKREDKNTTLFSKISDKGRETVLTLEKILEVLKTGGGLT